MTARPRDLQLTDAPGAVRPGEELPLAPLAGWLRRALAAAGEPAPAAAPLEVLQFRQGYSNLTYLLRLGDRELVLRRPPVGSRVATAHDMGREHRILSRLWRVFPLAPRALAACEDPSLLGGPFYVMERIPGVILRSRVPAGLELSAERAAALGESFVATLVALHQADRERAGLADLGRPQGYVARQVQGWSERWRHARGEPVPAIDALVDWLEEHRPQERGAALVHNDFKLDNLVLDPAAPSRIRGVLDWEMATVGDPWMDLGTALGYWVEATDPEPLRRLAFGPTHLPGMPRRREIAQRYAQLAASSTDPLTAAAALRDLPFYYAFGLFKIAVIAQQIYVRFARGSTRDERFAALPFAVRALGWMALQAAEIGEV
ncbi:MAG TPA: phosphotransferase family protein [Thermoanaerobaculia bacterium]|nr:phosphotransferase family protein [Thermoanaerobaculia bacterium]